MDEDRRRRRSADPLIALHYQLSHARKDGAFDAIVVADPSGVVVAGAGSWVACEELAAYAPLFAQDGLSDSVSSRIDDLRGVVDVCKMQVAGQEVLLCARGGEARKKKLEDAALGVSRILRAA